MANLLWLQGRACSGNIMPFLHAEEPSACDIVADFDNRWGMPARDSLCWPYGVAACGGKEVIADSGNDRVLLWEAAA
jgi:Ni,Fe-hydrogenase I small subunit